MSRAQAVRAADRAITGIFVGAGVSLLGGMLFSVYVVGVAVVAAAELLPSKASR